MKRRSFRNFLESKDIFGFDKQQARDEHEDNILSKPINQFNIELLMELLSKKSINKQFPEQLFVNEARWGHMPGSVKLEIDPGLTFYIKKLGVDKVGHPRWVTKRMFQLNRQGYGGLEDVVAQELYEHLKNYAEGGVDGPVEEYKGLEDLANHVYNKIKRVGKQIFIPEGIRKLSEDVYLLKFGVRAHGVEAMDHMRVEQNQTMISYDREQGTIRITNYNLESPVTGAHEWNIGVNDLDLYFFPSQSREEISECLSIHYKYY